MSHTFSPLLYCFVVLLLIGCSKNKNHTSDNTVQGSWNLVEIKDHDLNKWNEIGDTIMYQKHITPNSFVWFNFDKKNERLIGIGGGTYDFIDGKYTEYIAFFYPPITSLKGKPIPFDVEFKDGKWYHTGYFINEQIDIISGDVTQKDTVKIEEIWERTNQPINNNKELVGTWELQSYRDQAEDEYIEFPQFIGSIKLLTPTHFTWIKYDKQGDEVYMAGSGTYTFDDEAYTEEIHMIYPDNTGQINESIDFEYQLNDNLWYHQGFVPKVSIDSVGITKDSILIDEFWQPFIHTDVKELLL